MRLFTVFLLAIFLPGLAFAVENSEYDQNTIRAADLPKNPPRFEQYPALAAFSGKLAVPQVNAHPEARMFRTQIRRGAKEGPNFAGHYTVVFWGCGAGCVALAIVDANTGKVFFPDNLGVVDNINIADEELESADGSLVQFKLDSRLIVVIGGINETSELRGVSYFLWERNKLRRILFVAKPYRSSKHDLN